VSTALRRRRVRLDLAVVALLAALLLGIGWRSHLEGPQLALVPVFDYSDSILYSDLRLVPGDVELRMAHQEPVRVLLAPAAALLAWAALGLRGARGAAQVAAGLLGGASLLALGRARPSALIAVLLVTALAVRAAWPGPAARIARQVSRVVRPVLAPSARAGGSTPSPGSR